VRWWIATRVPGHSVSISLAIRPQHLFGHRPIRLVVELHHVRLLAVAPHGAGERHDRALLGALDAGDDVGEGEGRGGEGDLAARPAGHRGNQRELVAVGEGVGVADHLAVHGGAHLGEQGGDVGMGGGEGLAGVADRRGGGEVEGLALLSEPFAQHGKIQHFDAHDAPIAGGVRRRQQAPPGHAR
jgi:hypothetical protein